MKKIIVAAVIATVAVGFLTHTKSGARMLNSLGLATACGGSDNC
jgi:hypothetical protein